MTVSTPCQALVFEQRPSDFKPIVEVSACYLEWEGKYLFLKRAVGKSQENTWGVPAGKFEKGETPLDAVLREVFEEVGIALEQEQLNSVGALFVRYPHMDYVYHMFYQELSVKPEIRLSNEHEDWRWVTAAEAGELPLISGAAEALQHLLATKNEIDRSHEAESRP